MNTYIIKSDNHSGHGLPIGAQVTQLDTSDAPDWSDDGVEWYTQGAEGDEVAIDRRDLLSEDEHETLRLRGECEVCRNLPTEGGEPR